MDRATYLAAGNGDLQVTWVLGYGLAMNFARIIPEDVCDVTRVG